MTLFEPSPGAVIDRLTILEIKLEKAKAAGSKTSDMALEASRCETSVSKFLDTLDSRKRVELCLLFSRLFQRNIQQWNLEDRIRAEIRSRPGDPSTWDLDSLVKAVLVARDNADGNEHRAQLIRQIDELFGFTPEFKEYPK